MSPRNDMYLSLCLAQAEHSPLHYRHGSIIVRGGKVIGQGFNCYRPGFDGGALKSGVLPSNSLDGPAIVEFKQRLKCKWKPDGRSKLVSQQETCTFTPFESMGCGHGANGPLSMHSEMMAIRSALSLSSGTLSSQTSARSAKCFEKPCFKLPGDSKRKKARGRALKAYAEGVLKEAALPSTGKAHSGKFLPRDHKFNKEEGIIFHEKDVDLKRREKNKSEDQYQYKKTYQRKDGSKSPCSSKTNVRSSFVKPRSSNFDDDFISLRNSKSKYPKTHLPDPLKPQQILITKNKSLNTKPDVSARTKDLRLKGSDLYVVRLGNSNTRPINSNPTKSTNDPTVAPLSSPPEPASLYDELSPSSRSAIPAAVNNNDVLEHRPEIRDSRPCYRCVTAMHGVGIKRVFWTNQNSEWEGAKVRDLVEALEVGIEGDDGDGLGTGQENKGIFVTKHEVLMLKRMMGI